MDDAVHHTNRGKEKKSSHIQRKAQYFKKKNSKYY